MYIVSSVGFHSRLQNSAIQEAKASDSFVTQITSRDTGEGKTFVVSGSGVEVNASAS